ncbi:HAAS domain-containing protein [Paucisalibacillus globulus]|uniref:HAAS domain-containing protein n=1 Tax=Paucisalibacillus globulus TaxID=351095 RepID=UPI0006842E64|nr:hypothetical protein [Paucisalibacillus globulus]
MKWKNIHKEMKKVQVELSQKSKSFLENLRVYLFSSGKKSDEIEEIIEELESHLIEAEQHGKPIEKIIGKSPKAYMEMVSNEMAIDFRTWFQYIVIIIFGAFSFSIFQDILAGTLSYSILEIIGHIAITGIFTFLIFLVFKYISSNDFSNMIQVVILSLIGLVPVGLFFGLHFLNKSVETPIIEFGQTGSLTIAAITLLLIIGISLWAKTGILIAIVTLLTLPEYLLGKTTLIQETQLILSTIISFGGIGLYLFISSILTKDR